MGRNDLTGQMVMFPEHEERAHVGGGGILALPGKATCTPQEASRATGISVSQFRNWVDDGTLLAINAARDPVNARDKRIGTLNAWRIVVRRGEEFKREDCGCFLTLEELIDKSSNKSSIK
jgi:hypothetical protein